MRIGVSSIQVAELFSLTHRPLVQLLRCETGLSTQNTYKQASNDNMFTMHLQICQVPYRWCWFVSSKDAQMFIRSYEVKKKTYFDGFTIKLVKTMD